MTAYKPKRSLAAIITFALMLSITGYAAARAHLSPVTSAATVGAQDADIHTLKDAGLQFEVPKGWKVETKPDGVVLSFEDGAGSVTFVVGDDYESALAGMKIGLKQQLTDLKSDGEPKTDTHNGMTHISESGSGMMKGVKITWSLDVLKATKNVTILTFGIDTIVDAHAAEYEKLVKSLKKT